MVYEIRRTHRHRSEDSIILDTIETSSYDTAKEVFTDYVAGVLADDTTGRFLFVRFISKDGGFIDEAIAYPQPEDILQNLPNWYEGAGWYDSSENLLLLYDAGNHSSCEDDVDHLFIGDYDYHLAAQPVEQAPAAPDDDEDDAEDLRSEDTIRKLDDLRRDITKEKPIK